MATITLTIPDAVVTRVVAALCHSAGLPATPANAKAALIAYVKATVANIERADAEQAARDAVVVPAEPNVT